MISAKNDAFETPVDSTIRKQSEIFRKVHKKNDKQQNSSTTASSNNTSSRVGKTLTKRKRRVTKRRDISEEGTDDDIDNKATLNKIANPELKQKRSKLIADMLRQNKSDGSEGSEISSSGSTSASSSDNEEDSSGAINDINANDCGFSYEVFNAPDNSGAPNDCNDRNDDDDDIGDIGGIGDTDSEEEKSASSSKSDDEGSIASHENLAFMDEKYMTEGEFSTEVVNLVILASEFLNLGCTGDKRDAPLFLKFADGLTVNNWKDKLKGLEAREQVEFCRMLYIKNPNAIDDESEEEDTDEMPLEIPPEEEKIRQKIADRQKTSDRKREKNGLPAIKIVGTHEITYSHGYKKLSILLFPYDNQAISFPSYKLIYKLIADAVPEYQSLVKHVFSPYKYDPEEYLVVGKTYEDKKVAEKKWWSLYRQGSQKVVEFKNAVVKFSCKSCLCGEEYEESDSPSMWDLDHFDSSTKMKDKHDKPVNPSEMYKVTSDARLCDIERRKCSASCKKCNQEREKNKKLIRKKKK